MAKQKIKCPGSGTETPRREDGRLWTFAPCSSCKSMIKVNHNGTLASHQTNQ